MQIKNELQLDFKDVLIEPKRSSLISRAEVSILKSYTFLHSEFDWMGVPIIAANMDTVGTMTMAKKLAKHQCMTALHKHYTVEKLVEFFSKKTNNEDVEILEQNKHAIQHSFYSMGIIDKDLEKFNRVFQEVGYWDEGNKQGIKMVCLDVANGYTQSFVKFLREFRKKYPRLIIMAGNIVTGNMAEELLFSGADIIKVGIGPGSACTTRKIAGVGRPQLSAIIDTADAAHGLNGHICGDGGCTVPADIVKAFGAGGDFVMLGGMLAGHMESELEIIKKNGGNYLPFYGMSSSQAMDKHVGGVAEYKASEGKAVEIEYRGTVEKTILDILGGIRSACTYVGAKNLKELPKRTTFYRVGMQTNNIFANKE